MLTSTFQIFSSLEELAKTFHKCNIDKIDFKTFTLAQSPTSPSLYKLYHSAQTLGKENFTIGSFLSQYSTSQAPTCDNGTRHPSASSPAGETQTPSNLVTSMENTCASQARQCHSQMAKDSTPSKESPSPTKLRHHLNYRSGQKKLMSKSWLFMPCC